MRLISAEPYLKGRFHIQSETSRYFLFQQKVETLDFPPPMEVEHFSDDLLCKKSIPSGEPDTLK